MDNDNVVERPSVPEGLIERLQRPPRIKGQTPVDITLDAAEFRELMRHRSEAAAAISVGQNIIADLERRLQSAASAPEGEREPDSESLCHRCGKPYREHRIGYGAHRCTFAASEDR